METLSLNNPAFVTYIIAATLMILKVVLMSWLTVYRMMKVSGGFRSPEDLKKTPLNKEPSAEQLQPNDYVDRPRRIQQNDLENIPFFIAAGFLFLFTNPSPLMTKILLYGYVITKLLHFWAYLTAKIHDIRALFWTPGSLIIIYMVVKTLIYVI